MSDDTLNDETPLMDDATPATPEEGGMDTPATPEEPTMPETPEEPTTPEEPVV